MNEDILVKLALVRYVLIPRQLLAFDEAYGKDCFEFDRYYSLNKLSALNSTIEFINKVESRNIGSAYEEKCKSILAFVGRLPFMGLSSFTDLSGYNPFDDFEECEVDSYFLGRHIPDGFDAEDDEASLFWAASPEKYYHWYGCVENKTLLGLLQLYLNLLEKLS